MAATETLFWMNVGAFVCILLSFVYFVKVRDYEKSTFENSINVFLYGLLFVALAELCTILVMSETVYPSLLGALGLASYTTHLTMVATIGLLPLFAVCMLLSVVFARDAFELIE